MQCPYFALAFAKFSQLNIRSGVCITNLTRIQLNIPKSSRTQNPWKKRCVQFVPGMRLLTSGDRPAGRRAIRTGVYFRQVLRLLLAGTAILEQKALGRQSTGTGTRVSDNFAGLRGYLNLKFLTLGGFKISYRCSPGLLRQWGIRLKTSENPVATFSEPNPWTEQILPLAPT